MSSTPKHTFFQNTGSSSKSLTGNEVVISGIAGLFPKSDSVQEFMENLYNKVDMVTTKNDRWVFENNEMPKHFGFVKDMTKFDAQFFKVHYKQARSFECMGRKLLESTYAAVYDSGTNPMNLQGKNVGVFIGTSSSESEKTVVYENLLERNGFGISGVCRTMFANRISYWLDTKGPSYSLDLSCASGLMCIEQAYKNIIDGYCEAAIVGCSNYCMHPFVSLNYKRAGFLCMDGKTKSFDMNGDGYVRSDSINVFFLQKAKDAKRIYAEVSLIAGNYSLTSGDTFMPIRDVKFITNFFNEIYSTTDISTDEIEYIEGYAAGLGKADLNELEAIGKVFGKSKSIKVGSVKSNMGNSEAASSANALVKLCLAYHKGQIPANLHYYTPPNHIPEVREGKVKVLQDHSPFNRGYTAMNSFSVNGYDMHAVLKGHFKNKDLNRYQTSVPYLITVSGRQEQGMSKIIGDLKKQPIDNEQIALLHNIHSTNINGHMCRGYVILEKGDNNIPKCLAQKIEYYPAVTRPIWFLYSGMGSQWAGMGTELMRIPPFAAAIYKCHTVLKPKGIDIIKILTDPNKAIYDNILNSFIGIAAVQIGLTDILKEMGIIPDNIIGHSVGELGCAYADGCLTAEEMILSAYSRGLVSIQTPFIKGSMAAVGLGYADVSSLCPPEIEVACHNSSESATISGPVDAMKQFVSELTSRGVFAKEVPCSNIAYHSRYIAEAGPGLLQYLKDVITDPKQRSEKWLSTSVPIDKWHEPVAQYSSAEYHTNNLLNPVLFEETFKLIPSNAIVIEIAPHGLLQAIVKRSHSECTHIPLTRRGHPDPVKYLLEAIGEMYTIGMNPKLEAIYPKVEFPVSTETAMLSHLVQWEHSENWPYSTLNTKDRTIVMERQFIMSIYEDDYKYLAGHIRNGQCVFPETGLLVLVWETLAMAMNTDFRKMSVQFNDVKFSGEVIIQKEIPLELNIMINKGNMFEVSFEETTIVSGYIQENKTCKSFTKLPTNNENQELYIRSNDIYKMFCIRGHTYRDEFQSIKSINANIDRGIVKWNNNWTTFLNGLIQLNALATGANGVLVPKLIRQLMISIDRHNENKRDTMFEDCFNVDLDRILKITRCDSVEISDLIFVNSPYIEQSNYLQTKIFFPHQCSLNINMDTAVQVLLQIVKENLQTDVIKVTEIKSNITSEDMASKIKQITRYIPSTEFIITTTAIEDIDNRSVLDTNLLIIHDSIDYITNLINLSGSMAKDSFVMVIEKDKSQIQKINNLFTVISDVSVGEETVLLLKNAINLTDNVVYIPIVHDDTFSWVPRLQTELTNSKRIVLVSENQQLNGALGFVKNYMKVYPHKLSVIIVDDENVPSFHCDTEIFKKQLDKNLKINILKKGQWGGEYYIQSDTSFEANHNFGLTCLPPNDIDSLKWVEKPLLAPGHNFVQVCYSAVSQNDIRNLVNNDILEQSFGMDFSGFDYNGHKVMGIVKSGALATQVEADPEFIWPVPDHWSLEDAATVPLPYILAYYCLTIKSKVKSKFSVLVTSGAGALGQAVISVCFGIGCEVFTTVSDTNKKNFLLKTFPQLDEKNVTCSHDNAFYDVINANSNKGCNIVINCKSGILHKSSLNCTSKFGRFIDLSTFDSKENKSFGMGYLGKETNYCATQILNIFTQENNHEKKMLHGLIAEGIAKGHVKPITRVVYSPKEVSKAFRLISSSRSRGRVLISMNDPTTQHLKIIPKITCLAKSCYVVVCDKNDLAVGVIDELVKQGAKYVMMHVKSEQSSMNLSGYMAVKLRAWKKLNVVVEMLSESLQIEKNCAELLTHASKLGPVHGVFIVLDSSDNDKNIVEQSQFVCKFNNTATIVSNLDSASRQICRNLSYFAVLMNETQNPADFYNSATVERICQRRNDMGLPALVYNIAINIQLRCEERDCQSILLQSMTSILNGLHISLKLKHNNVQILMTNLTKKGNLDFLQKISRIIGVNNIDDIDENLTVSELVVVDTTIMEIKSIIKIFFGIDFTYDKILSLSIASLKQLHKKYKKQNTNLNGGLSAFYTYVDEDECLASEPMVALVTKANNIVEISDTHLSSNEPYMMMIPGFDGHYQVFNSICKTLKVQARVLQLGPDLRADSISQIACVLLKFLKSRFTLQTKFYLMGYSFGVNVALELAALIEKEGFTGVVYCLDSSPDALRAQLDAYLGDQTKSQLQNSIVEHVYRLLSGHSSYELSSNLQRAKSWPDKIQACINKVKGIVKYSNGYKESIILSAYERILLARSYVPDFKLQSQIVLMKGIPHPNQVHLPDDYNLSQYTYHPVQVFNIESDHALAPEDCRVTNILNKFIDPQILQEFNKKNLCESYMTVPYSTLF